jgi:hypothetical protein
MNMFFFALYMIYYTIYYYVRTAGDEELWRSRCYAEMRGHVQAVEDLKHKEKIASYRALYPRLLGTCAITHARAHKERQHTHTHDTRKLANAPARAKTSADFPYMEWDERQSAVVTNRGLTARTTRRGETIYTAKQPLRSVPTTHSTTCVRANRTNDL